MKYCDVCCISTVTMNNVYVHVRNGILTFEVGVPQGETLLLVLYIKFMNNKSAISCPQFDHKIDTKQI